MSMKRDDWVTDIGTAVVGASAAVLTFTTLRDLAEGCGIAGWLAWLVPVTVDAAGIIAARVWLRGGRAEVVVFARALAWVCIAESILGNAGQHYMTALEVTPPWWVVVLVSAVPPATLGAVVHLGHLRGRTDTPDGGTVPRTVPRTDTVPPAEDTPEAPELPERPETPDRPVLTSVPSTPVTPADLRTVRADDLLDDVRVFAEELDRPLSAKAVRSRFGIGHDRATRLVDALKEHA